MSIRIKFPLSLNDYLVTESGGSQIFSEWRQDVSVSGLGPPFETSFYTVRLVVTTDMSDLVRTVSLCYLLSLKTLGAIHSPVPRN